jgi:hypothetical protein
MGTAIFRSGMGQLPSVGNHGPFKSRNRHGTAGRRGTFCGLPILDPFPVPPPTVVAERELATPRPCGAGPHEQEEEVVPSSKGNREGNDCALLLVQEPSNHHRNIEWRS